MCVYHDEDSMPERPVGLQGVLVIVIVILPLHALLDDRTGFWVISLSVQEELPRHQVLHRWVA